MEVRSAGAVVLGPSQDQVLLVHRPRYDDWSFPKGKLDPGEHAAAAAVREVREETGLGVRLGPPLSGQRYALANGRTKTVAYWTGQLLDGSDPASVEGYTYGEEIDRVAWVPLGEAPAVLTYPYDRDTLAEALAVSSRTVPLVVLRHAQAHPRRKWREDDRLRPLAPAGRAEARALVPLLEAYGVAVVVTSSSVRCGETVAPYAGVLGRDPLEDDRLTEEDASVSGVSEVVGSLLARAVPAVLCTHRPVLPLVLDALGIDRVSLAPAELLVVHHGEGRVVALERHRLPG